METAEICDALVIGSGPAGLMAADRLSAAGLGVIVAEARPSIGRKFLMAGKSGLNLTRAQSFEPFLEGYPSGADWLAPMLAAFGPGAVRAWAADLGQPTFIGGGGRVFPDAMKASPLLRAWRDRLTARGVEIRTRWRWTGWTAGAVAFEAPGGLMLLRPRVTVLALGGASWARLGSDGAWAATLAAAGVALTPFSASNVGWLRHWSQAMRRHFGAPVKAAALTAGGRRVRGEFVVTARGVEGGAIYALGPELRAGAALSLDLLPDLDEPTVATRLARPRGKVSFGNHLRRTLGLPPVKRALLRECAGDRLETPARIAAALKGLPLRLEGLAPIDEAISTAGGVAAAGLDADLMLRARPGVFCAGEMLDWDALTGGYLITACLATGRRAGDAAARWAQAAAR